MTSAPPQLFLAVTAQEDIDYFFRLPTALLVYKCKNCGQMMRQMKNSGFSNLRDHSISFAGKIYEMESQQCCSHSLIIIVHQSATVLSANSFVSTYVCKLITWVFMQHKPISKVDKSFTREGMEYSTVTS